MGFKTFFESKELEDELQKLKDLGIDVSDLELDSYEDEDDEEVNLDIDGDDDVDGDDIDGLLSDLTDEEDDKKKELKELKEKVKNAQEILKDRFKKGSRKLILDKMSGGKKVTPILLAQFKTNFEFDNKLGKFGKWVKRKNKGEFKQKNPLKKMVKTIKGKAKRMRKMMKKGNVLAKIEKGKRRSQAKVGDRTVKLQGE